MMQHIKGLTPKERISYLTLTWHNNSTKFEIDQPVMVKGHTHHTFKPKYLSDYKVLKEKQILTMLNLEAQQMLGIWF